MAIPMTESNPILVAVDDGFRQIKLVTADRRHAQLSVARPGFTLGGALGSAGGDAGAGAYRTQGRDFTVDPDIEGEDTRFDDYALSDINRVLVHHALYANGLSGRDVVLASGLPFGLYFRAGTTESNGDLLKRKMENLAIPVESMDGRKPPRIVGQFVGAQGLMAYIDYALDDANNWREGMDPSAPVVVVDVGGRTTDTATIIRGSTVDHAASGTINVGVTHVLDHLRSLIMARFDVAGVRPSRLETFLRSGKVQLRGEWHDISAEREQAVDLVLQQVRRELQRRVGDAADMQAVLLVGGGAALLASGLKTGYRHLVVPEDPEFANARGMLKTLRGNVAA